MADVVLSVSLLLAAAAAVILALRAVRHWWSERAGQPYELPADHRGTMLWAAAAGVAAVVAVVLAVPLLVGGGPAKPGRGTPAAAPPPVLAPAPAHTPQPAPPPPTVRTIGYPAGGTLQELRDGTRVWLPPHYDSARAAGLSYPVVIAHLPADPAQAPAPAPSPGSTVPNAAAPHAAIPNGTVPNRTSSSAPAATSSFAATSVTTDPDLYDGFAIQAKRGLADPFVLVLPRDCGQDSAAVLAEVATRYRTLTARSARAVIGVGTAAPCAVQEALAHPDRYRAAAGVSGTYPPLPPSSGSAGSAASTTATSPRTSLLLASATGEVAPRAAALRLRTVLHARGDDGVRIIDGVRTRRELLALVSGYLTEKLDGPARPAHPAKPTAPAKPSGLKKSVPRQ
ncbi:hypothetical protein [Streptomyces sp. CA-111067]|uniref:hypothetical protein n=1 Tax=Streptomyces sp. CA-111067 TaxID=3240046 RepID=UPI003D973D88